LFIVILNNYNSNSDAVTINTMSLDDGNLHELGGLLDTVTHEMRHNLQHEAVENPERFPDIPRDVIASWAVNFQDGNYIRYSDDPRGYNDQPVEADAWSFAEETLRRANWQYGVDDFVD
jgi:hypothetical protein